MYNGKPLFALFKPSVEVQAVTEMTGCIKNLIMHSIYGICEDFTKEIHNELKNKLKLNWMPEELKAIVFLFVAKPRQDLSIESFSKAWKKNHVEHFRRPRMKVVRNTSAKPLGKYLKKAYRPVGWCIKCWNAFCSNNFE